MRIAAGLLLIVVSLIAIWILYSDLKQAELFKQEGVKTKAIVIGIGSMVFNSRGDPWTPLNSSPVAFDYSYTVSGKEYIGHATHNFYLKAAREVGWGWWHIQSYMKSYVFSLPTDLHKGDSIPIEYLAGNPAISCYAGDMADAASIRLLIDIFAGLAVIGLALGVWPDKKRPEKIYNEEDHIDWSEYERTHD